MSVRNSIPNSCIAAVIVLISAAMLPLSAADTNPTYNVQTIVHAATQTVEALAPNTIATIYGTNLCYTTHSVGSNEVTHATLPTTLDGVSVYVNGLLANLFYVSPTQINFLIPYELTAGTVTVIVARQGVAGPAVKIQLNATAPGLFPWGGNYAIAVHLDASLISPDVPAKAGEIIVLYAAGLGRTTPDTSSGRVVSSAATILANSQLQVLLDGKPLGAASVLYAGLAPGFAGLYQINLKLPDALPHNPEIRLAIGAQISPALVRLATQ